MPIVVDVVYRLSWPVYADPRVAGLCRSLTDGRTGELAEYTDEIGELVTFIVVQAGDAVEQIDAALGFGILSNRFDAVPFGAPGFTPSWDSLTEHTGWFELTYVLSDDGFGIVVYVPKTATLKLLSMCSRHTSSA